MIYSNRRFARIATFLFMFVAFFTTLSSQNYTISNLSFEKKWILKNLVDEYFIEASLFETDLQNPDRVRNLQMAYEYYERASVLAPN